MKKIRLSVIFIFALSLTLIFALIGCSATKAPSKKVVPPKTTNPAATNPNFLTDNWPNGCLSCHKQGDKNYSLNSEVKKIKDHPSVNVSGVKDCYNCHSKTREALKNWRNRLHKIHVTPQSKFVTKVKGNCVACHKINNDTGEIVVKGLEGVQPPPPTTSGTTGTGTTGAGTTRTQRGTGAGTTTPGTQSGTSTPGTTTPGR